jgi:ADP-heptose:LPS heptosyltransferase
MHKHIDLTNKTILISRSDSIGDVVLTLPVCVWLKQQFPSVRILFLGSTYTKPIIACLPEVDEVLDWKEFENIPLQERIARFKTYAIDVVVHVFPRKEIASLARKAGIPQRIGTSHRPFHFLTCNIRPNFTRKKSDLHESQLNFELFRVFGVKELPSLATISTWMEHFKAPSVELPLIVSQFIESHTKAVILHPKSQGSALEWGIENYVSLANKLISNGFGVVFTGTENEGVQFRNQLPKHASCLDTSGMLSLQQLIALIGGVDGLVACSTGPLHIAGVLGKRACGLYSPRKPIHPGRWKALGKEVKIFVFD